MFYKIRKHTLIGIVLQKDVLRVHWAKDPQIKSDTKCPWVLRICGVLSKNRINLQTPIESKVRGALLIGIFARRCAKDTLSKKSTSAIGHEVSAAVRLPGGLQRGYVVI
jgi:hypothetical protein